MVIVPNGRQCYCGKKGCLDAYCSAKVLRREDEDTIERFFEDLNQGFPENIQMWDTYLEHLAVAVSNLRMAYDCDIILGGNVGGNMEGHMYVFEEKLKKYNNFDYDTSYIRLGKYRRECSAIGAARLMQDQYIERIETFSVAQSS
ncbi:MAG: ROK family protein [Lachnospiraceae bacterium]|nr:ROK family protein [Lachnospiraceae bacterium]